MTSKSAGDRDTPIIDFGAHLLPNATPNPLFDKIEVQTGAPVHRDPDAALGVFELAGLDGAVLSQPEFMGHADAERTAAANDTLLEIVGRYEEFYGLAAVPTAAGGEAAATEFERSLDAGYNGGAIETMTDGIEVIDETVEPILEVAADTGAPLMVHPLINDSLGAGVLDDTWKLNATFGREVALCESLCKVVHTGVFDRYPDLTLVYHHTGGNIAAMLGRVELQLQRDLWPGLDETKPYGEFKAALDEHVYIDTAGYFGYELPVRAALEELPSTNVMFATDFPYETRTPEGFVRLVEGIEGAAPEDADRILGRNALDVMINVD